MKNPLVSIIVPTLNSEKTIEACLKSLKKQRHKNIEIIVVDEFSKDKTGQIARNYAKVFLKKGERSVARNFGINKSKGDYILIIDSDMELSPDVIKECVEKSSKNAALVIPEISAGVGYWTKCRVLDRFCTTAPDQQDNNIEAARFFPRSLIKKIGGYDVKMTGVEDWDLQQRLIKKNIRIKKINNYIIHHEGSLSLLKNFKKKMYYGRAFLKYKKRHPEAFKNAFLRTAYLKNWKRLIKDPIHLAGMILLKLVEGSAIISGMLLFKDKQ